MLLLPVQPQAWDEISRLRGELESSRLPRPELKTGFGEFVHLRREVRALKQALHEKAPTVRASSLATDPLDEAHVADVAPAVSSQPSEHVGSGMGAGVSDASRQGLRGGDVAATSTQAGFI